jgi:peptidoglycan hydrolase-like protein with peptidoglycan-binding domain
MRASKLCCLLMAMLCLGLWPVAVTARVDWRVAQVQELLKDAGFNPGPIDGILGPRTKGALRRYQASQGLPATGALDEATRQALLPSGLIQGTHQRAAKLNRRPASKFPCRLRAQQRATKPNQSPG